MVACHFRSFQPPKCPLERVKRKGRDCGSVFISPSWHPNISRDGLSPGNRKQMQFIFNLKTIHHGLSDVNKQSRDNSWDIGDGPPNFELGSSDETTPALASNSNSSHTKPTRRL
ncbi:hypothetical protein TNCV_4246571 [Trichonephila clavipes]|nr:hypothetical protein TNCV_4246571 [Trichonephila clavipes]